jgi:hypothetical protein
MGSNRGASGRGDGYLGKRPGLFLHQADGRPVPKTLDAAWQRAHKEIPEFADAAFHGLRGTRVVELRRRGATTLQIQDTVGMSIRMVERYCRFADKKANAMATVVLLGTKRIKDGAL